MSGESQELTSFSVCPVCHDAVATEDIETDSGICALCVQRSTMRKERTESREKAKNVFREMIKQARPDAILAPHISEVCAGVVRELGGIERFCEELVDDYRDARERSPGSATVVRFGESILRLVRDSSTLRDSAPDAVNLSEEELANEMLAMMERVVMDQGLEVTEDNIADMFIGDASGRQSPQEIERAGEGEPKQEEGSAEVLPSDK